MNVPPLLVGRHTLGAAAVLWLETGKYVRIDIDHEHWKNYWDVDSMTVRHWCPNKIDILLTARQYTYWARTEGDYIVVTWEEQPPTFPDPPLDPPATQPSWKDKLIGWIRSVLST